MVHRIPRAVLAALLLTACPSTEDDAGATHPSSGADTTGSTGEGNDTIGGNASAVCQAYAEHFAECSGASDYQVVQAQGDCEAELHGGAPAGASCRAATEAFYECLTGLACGSFDEGAGCPDERDAAAGACEGNGGGSSSGG